MGGLADLSIAILAALTGVVLVDAGVRWWSAMGDAYGPRFRKSSRFPSRPFGLQSLLQEIGYDRISHYR